MKSARAITLALAIAGAHPLAAQEPQPPQPPQPVQEVLPDSIAERVVDIYNRDGTLRLNGDAEIAASMRVDGAVAALNGPLRIAGVVTGDVVIINGNALLLEGAQVTGDVIAVGGSIERHPGARVDGALLVYREPLRFRYQDGRLRYVPPHLERGLSAGREWRFGRADLFVAAHDAYNRVEGLPIAFGPRLRLGNSKPTTLQAFAIYRTSNGFGVDADDFGYLLTAEQQLGLRGLRAAVRAYSEVAPIESWQVSEREASLAAFLLHRDYRDHFERTGWAAALRFLRNDRPLSAELWYRHEDHTAVLPGSPFTIMENNDPWRPEPIVAQGTLRSITAQLRYDTRNDPADASFGWLIEASLEQGVSGDLLLPEGIAGAASARTDFNNLQLDLRRYLRLSPYAQLAIRGLFAGSLDGNALPPQRQHALGGEGSLPAFGLLQFDCSAREQMSDSVPLSYYGCDRISLVQLEYQASFPLARRLVEKVGLTTSFTNAVRWVAFFNAGRAWSEPEARDGRGGGLSDYAADAGIGLRVGTLGAYWAVPLSGTDKRINFFVRVGPTL